MLSLICNSIYLARPLQPGSPWPLGGSGPVQKTSKITPKAVTEHSTQQKAIKWINQWHWNGFAGITDLIFHFRYKTLHFIYKILSFVWNQSLGVNICKWWWPKSAQTFQKKNALRFFLFKLFFPFCLSLARPHFVLLLPCQSEDVEVPAWLLTTTQELTHVTAPFPKEGRSGLCHPSYRHIAAVILLSGGSGVKDTVLVNRKVSRLAVQDQRSTTRWWALLFAQLLPI